MTNAKEAHWIRERIKPDMEHLSGMRFKCSVCGEAWGYGETPYCPECGKPMTGEPEEVKK